MTSNLLSRAAFSGHIQVIFGPMFSGKTTEMLARVNRYQLANRVCRLVKYHNDRRYNNTQIATHDGLVSEAISALRISDVMNQLQDAEVVGIDEGQFFDDIAECSESLANDGKIVIVSALDGDFTRKHFRNILSLCPISERYEKLSAVCKRCGKDASFTKRLTNETKQEVIGGAEKYEAVCRQCYFADATASSADASELQPGQPNLGLGRIELIFGNEHSGKTTELLRRRQRFILRNKTCKIITGRSLPKGRDLAFTNHYVRSGENVDRMEGIFSELMKYDVVLVDDGHRFPDAVDCSERLANAGKIVVVAAYDGDRAHQEFGIGVVDLIPKAEEVLKIRAVCDDCKADAAFSMADGTKDMEAKMGFRKAHPVCRDCFMRSRRRTERDLLPRVPLKQSN